jgi:hypothetical protein
MPREPDPVNDDELYNSLELGGKFSPGVVTISGHNRKIEWDVKNGSGQSGASTTLKSIPPVEISCAFFMATGEQFALWPEWRDHVNSTISGKTPKAMDAYHPDLAANGITSLVLSEFGGVVHDKKGGQTITIKFQEYKAPKPKGGTPAGSKAKKAVDPNAAANAELAALTAKYAATPWEGL